MPGLRATLSSRSTVKGPSPSPMSILRTIRAKNSAPAGRGAAAASWLADHHRLHLGDVDAAEGIGLVERLLHEARVGEIAERGREEIAPARVDLLADGGGRRKQRRRVGHGDDG